MPFHWTKLSHQRLGSAVDEKSEANQRGEDTSRARNGGKEAERGVTEGTNSNTM